MNIQVRVDQVASDWPGNSTPKCKAAFEVKMSYLWCVGLSVSLFGIVNNDWYFPQENIQCRFSSGSIDFRKLVCWCKQFVGLALITAITGRITQIILIFGIGIVKAQRNLVVLMLRLTSSAGDHQDTGSSPNTNHNSWVRYARF